MPLGGESRIQAPQLDSDIFMTLHQFCQISQSQIQNGGHFPRWSLEKKQYFRKLDLLGRINRGDQIDVLRTANSSRNVAAHCTHFVAKQQHIYIL